MRWLVFSDIHGYPEAVDRALEQAKALMKSYDAVAVLGDLVGYGPSQAEAVESVRTLAPRVLVQGNHDAWAVRQTGVFSEEIRAFLAGMPLVSTHGDATFVHASPIWPEEFPELRHPPVAGVMGTLPIREVLREMPTRLAFVGHAHRPGIWFAVPRAGNRTPDVEAIVEPVGTIKLRGRRAIVNVGSVALASPARDKAWFVLFDAEADTVEFVELPAAGRM